MQRKGKTVLLQVKRKSGNRHHTRKCEVTIFLHVVIIKDSCNPSAPLWIDKVDNYGTVAVNIQLHLQIF